MEAGGVKLLEFIKNSSQFIIPIYQRTYSWEIGHCQQLWNDIMRVGESDNGESHFVGSVVYVRKGESAGTPLFVIDGQQRLTTVSLILEALARRLENNRDEDEQVKGLSDNDIRRNYFPNKSEKGEGKYKLVLTQTDKEILQSLLGRSKLPDDYSSSDMWKNFNFFEERIARLDNLTPFWKGLNKLMIVYVALNREQNNPQQIFESMNHMGKKLNQADLIRNFVLMGLEPEYQDYLYEDYWVPMEKMFGKELKSLFDWFMRDYLTLKNDGMIPNIGNVYEEFKVYRYKTNENAKILVFDIHKFASYYCAMALKGREKNEILAPAFAELRELGSKVTYPFLLRLYDDYDNGDLSPGEFSEIIRLIVNYVFRRAVCKIPTNTLNKTFATLGKNIKKDRYLESVKAHFLRLDSNRRFPNDEEFIRGLKQIELYKTRICKYTLLNLENYNNKEPVQAKKCSVEHIMPQKLTPEWKATLGDDWEDLLHTLGNLTLTGRNSELGNRQFKEKSDEYRNSSFRLNRELAGFKEWNEKTIQQRAEQLARLATTIWERPKLSREVLNTYYPEHKIDDHGYLAKRGITRQLFDIFSAQVKSLSPDITEEFLKWHIAYKLNYETGTNFVNVTAQAKKLKLTLSMDFHELDDPKRIANDFADRNYWMPGNVELDVKSEDEIPYAIGLVRQALKKQMGK